MTYYVYLNARAVRISLSTIPALLIRPLCAKVDVAVVEGKQRYFKGLEDCVAGVGGH